jgi:hypothetical protein
VVHVGADGRVRSVRLLWHRDGRRPTWEQVAADAAASLVGSQFPLRSSFAQGAFVEVQVASNVALPSGSDTLKRFERPRRFEAKRWPFAPKPGPRLSRREEGHWTPPPPELARITPVPETTLPPCDPAEPLCPSFRFDLSDLVTPRSRSVRTYVRVEPARGDKATGAPGQ